MYNMIKNIVKTPPLFILGGLAVILSSFISFYELIKK